MPVSQSDFRRFRIATAKAGRACSHCGHEGFALNLGTHDDNGPVAEFRFRPEDSAFGTHGFYSMACTNCGRTDFFHVTQVDRWVAANSKKAD